MNKLNQAAKSGQLTECKRILNEKGTTQEDINLALYSAVLRDRLDIVQLMIENGANNYNASIWNAHKLKHTKITEYFKAIEEGTDG